MVIFENEYTEKPLEQLFDFDWEAVAEAVAEQVLTQEDCPYETDVELILTTEEEICRLNMEHRSLSQATDVLSFPMVDYTAPADFSSLEDGSADFCFDPDTGRLQLGDIVLCVPRVLAQAKEYGHSKKREYAFLIAHSMLHLLGYDHMTKEEAKDMEARQEQALMNIGITRESEA